MFTEFTSWGAVILILLASSGLLISRDWRWSLSLLAMQYVGATWLVAQHWPVGMASVKLVTGWMATAALGMTRLSVRQGDMESFSPRGRWFRIFLASIVVLLSAAASPQMERVIPGLGLPVIIGSTILAGMGMMHLGITSEILRVILGLLTLLTGFEILYAAVESSILVAGLLAVVNLGLALAGAYLMMADSAAEESA